MEDNRELGFYEFGNDDISTVTVLPINEQHPSPSRRSSVGSSSSVVEEIHASAFETKLKNDENIENDIPSTIQEGQSQGQKKKFGEIYVDLNSAVPKGKKLIVSIQGCYSLPTAVSQDDQHFPPSSGNHKPKDDVGKAKYILETSGNPNQAGSLNKRRKKKTSKAP